MRFSPFLAALLLSPTLLHAQYRLDPVFETGTRWSKDYKVVSRTTHLELPGGIGDTPAAGFLEVKNKIDIRCLEAMAGELTQAEIVVEQSEIASQAPGATRAVSYRQPLAGRIIRMTRKPGLAGEVRWELTPDSGALTPDEQAMIRGAVVRSPFPPRVLKVGERWESEDVDLLLDVNMKGQMLMEFSGVENAPDGRQLAVVRFRGHGRLDRPPTHGPDGRMATVDVVMEVNFDGTMRVDVKSRQLVAWDLEGRSRTETGSTVGPPIVTKGDLTSSMRRTELPPMPPPSRSEPPTPPPQPSPTPQPTPAPQPSPQPQPQPSPQPQPTPPPGGGDGGIGGGKGR